MIDFGCPPEAGFEGNVYEHVVLYNVFFFILFDVFPRQVFEDKSQKTIFVSVFIVFYVLSSLATLKVTSSIKSSIYH